MKRDDTHDEQIERWAKFVKENPDKWKAKVKPLIDSQILMARRFYKNLMKTPKGREKIKELRNKMPLLNKFKTILFYFII